MEGAPALMELFVNQFVCNAIGEELEGHQRGHRTCDALQYRASFRKDLFIWPLKRSRSRPTLAMLIDELQGEQRDWPLFTSEAVFEASALGHHRSRQ
jgi:hypothetical protein